LNRLHFALAPEGVLFLGHAEMLLSHSDKFTPINLKHRIFRRAAGSQSDVAKMDVPDQRMERHGNLSGLGTIRELAFAASPVAQIVVTGDETVAMIN
jgi:two-component system CheB/CheR fusion protein